jgi:hypothetical protein
MERLAIDVTGPFPRTQKGNKYIVVISDYFTKWISSFCYKGPMGKNCCECSCRQCSVPFWCATFAAVTKAPILNPMFFGKCATF